MNRLEDNLKVVIGAGEYSNNPGWIETQEEELSLLNVETWQNKFAEGSITAILAEHVFEHLTYEEGVEAAKLCYRYLKPSGYVRCAVPDGYFSDEAYQQMIQVGGPGPCDHPAASHKIVHNYHTLSNMFKTAGFKIKLLEYCDEDGVFHANEWHKKDGVIFRSKKCDPRNQGDKLVFPSLIIDAIKK